MLIYPYSRLESVKTNLAIDDSDEGSQFDAPFELCVFDAGSQEHRDVECALLNGGISLPMSYRVGVARPTDNNLLVAVRNSAGQWVGATLIQIQRVPALPGYSKWRIDHLGQNIPVAAQEITLRFILNMVRINKRVLHLKVRVFARDRELRLKIGREMEHLGFRRTEPNDYTRTVAVDLRPPAAVVIKSFNKSVHRRVRKFERAEIPVSVEPITEHSFAPRMNELVQQTMARTGGRFVPIDWAARINLARTQPDVCRIVGVIQHDLTGSEKLLAFAYGCHHGTLAHYADGASVRRQGLSVPLMYPLLCDLIMWARDHGAEWFDMGGITLGRFGDGQDPLGGISDFKRQFSEDVIDIADEWVWAGSSAVAMLTRGARHANKLITMVVTAVPTPGRLIKLLRRASMAEVFRPSATQT
jgi:hypothetical protein